MSKGKMWALGIAVVIHIFLGYALLTGLALKIVKHIVEPMKTVNVKEEAPPPDEPPPPPPKDVEIPPFVPPPEVTVASEAPPTITVQSQAPSPPQPTYVAPPAPPAPAAPPAPKGPTQGASLDPRSTTTTEDDYPPASLRAGEEGVTTVTLSINTQGRVDKCDVAQTSSFTRLDEKTCQIALRRFRGKPALQDGTPVASTKVQRVRWQIPKG